jgi:hypothetical protein
MIKAKTRHIGTPGDAYELLLIRSVKLFYLHPLKDATPDGFAAAVRECLGKQRVSIMLDSSSLSGFPAAGVPASR